MPAPRKNPHALAQQRGLRALYGTHRWRKIAQQQLLLEPWCRNCFSVGRYERATACDHIGGFHDVNSFWSGPFQSLCKRCSDSKRAGHDITWTTRDGSRADLVTPPRLMPEC
jgi:5-methylcytosine-specific restriction enzyme A